MRRLGASLCIERVLISEGAVRWGKALLSTISSWKRASRILPNWAMGSWVPPKYILDCCTASCDLTSKPWWVIYKQNGRVWIVTCTHYTSIPTCIEAVMCFLVSNVESNRKLTSCTSLGTFSSTELPQCNILNILSIFGMWKKRSLS